ncbi:MAG: hypothetical protein WKF37_01540 [Bryobacteraceae bacterium]
MLIPTKESSRKRFSAPESVAQPFCNILDGVHTWYLATRSDVSTIVGQPKNNSQSTCEKLLMSKLYPDGALVCKQKEARDSREYVCVVYAEERCFRFPVQFMSFRNAPAALLVFAWNLCGADPSITIDTPMAPPEWALLQRELLSANSKAADRFAAKYLDERGYLLHTMRWGTLDGPDDAIETFYNWTLLHALGGSNSVLQHYKKALEGHYKQYGELRTKLTRLAENGAYYKEFITQSDWFHRGWHEGVHVSVPVRPERSTLPIAHEAICGDVYGRGSGGAELRS